MCIFLVLFCTYNHGVIPDVQREILRWELRDTVSQMDVVLNRITYMYCMLFLNQDFHAYWFDYICDEIT